MVGTSFETAVTFAGVRNRFVFHSGFPQKTRILVVEATKTTIILREKVTRKFVAVFGKKLLGNLPSFSN